MARAVDGGRRPLRQLDSGHRAAIIVDYATTGWRAPLETVPRGSEFHMLAEV